MRVFLAASLLFLVACQPGLTPGVTCVDDGCLYAPGDENDPIIARTAGATNLETQRYSLIGSSCTVADCPSGYNIIQGTQNDDTLTGTSGNDCILGGNGQDKLYGVGGNDFLCGGNGDDLIEGGDGDDLIYGEQGQDRLYGNDGNDTIDGGQGDDEIRGGAGDDSLKGAQGNDRLYGDAGNDTLNGSEGDDQLNGGDGTDSLYGEAGHDTINGDAGDDQLVGGAGSNNLNGGAGYNWCDGPGVSCNGTYAPDTTAPSTNVTTPSGAVATGAITINGTATDAAPGLIANVQVSTDGTTWTNVSAPGANWSHVYTPSATGTAVLLFRAIDNSNNVDATPATFTVTYLAPLGACTPETTARTLATLTSAAGSNPSLWPMNVGWDAELGGDWQNNGNGGFATGAKPTMTSFYKTVDVCPNANSHINFVADVETTFSSGGSDTTLVLYFFNAQNAYIGHATSSTLKASNRTSLPLYEAWIPAGTRRVVFAPTAYLAGDEQATLTYFSITGEYVPGGTYYQAGVVATDDFSSFSEGSLNPTGWTESAGGDWFVEPPYNWATLTNPAFRGESASLPITATFSRSFTLPERLATDMLQAKVYSSSTFSDARSYGLVRLAFNDGAATKVVSQKITKTNHLDIFVSRAAIPAGATTVTVEVEAYLAPNEASSLTVDDLLVRLIRR